MIDLIFFYAIIRLRSTIYKENPMSTKRITLSQIEDIEITAVEVMHILRHLTTISAEARLFLKLFGSYQYTNKLKETWTQLIDDEHIDACLAESGSKFIGIYDPFEICQMVKDALVEAASVRHPSLQWPSKGEFRYASLIVPGLSMLGTVGLVRITDENKSQVVSIQRGSKNFNGIKIEGQTTTDVVVQLIKENGKVRLQTAYTGFLTRPQSDTGWWSQHAFII